MSVRIRHNSRWLVGVLPALLVTAASAMAFFKIAYLGYTLDAIVQTESYYLETVMEFDGHGSAVDIAMALPQNLTNQSVSDEAFNSGDLKFEVETIDGDRLGVWRSDGVDGRRRLTYTATVITKNQKFVIDSTLISSESVPDSVARYLLTDTAIQSDSPEMARLADSLALSPDSTVLANTRAIYNFTTFGLKYVQYSGTTDALTAYHLGEASCGGKARLFAALARHIGLPTRLVGGKILSQGQSRATHIWVEAYIAGYWVPFCPTNKYFAEIPSDYLILYYGEKPAITHTKDINFKYFFNLKKRLVQNSAGITTAGESPLDILNIWATFKRVAISLELLRIIIMLPIGILAVVLFRNLIGIETFGTFMPALLAIGFRDTGLTIGVALFATIIAFGALVRLVLSRLQLLHTPRLAIILSSLVLFILGITILGVRLGWLDVARVALFPMVILTLTVERFSLVTEEFGVKHAARTAALTLAVAAVAYGLMSWRFLQSLVISFPELILVVIALYIYIGRYSGFRLMEYVRFKHLLIRA